MKTITKIFFGFAAVMFFSLAANAQNNNNDNALIGKAHGAAAQCLADARQSGCNNIEAQVVTTGICFAGGFLQTVQFFCVPACHGNPSNPCPRPAAELVAEVTFGCEGEVINVTCY